MNDNAVSAVKGFNLDWTCRDEQYEIGQTYTIDDAPVLCSRGFHACEMPLDAWSYYGPATSIYAAVELNGQTARAEDADSKIVSGCITIRAELKLTEVIDRAVKWIVDRAKDNIATGDFGHAAATGKCSHAATTGNYGHAAATGNYGHAAATGNYGHAAATGYYGHAAATGNYGHAAATGYSGHAAATGDFGHAAATGNYGHAAATGNYGHAAATGYSGHAAAIGNYGHAATTGNYGHAAATGNYGHAAATGNYGHAAATGNYGHAAVAGRHSVAVALGASATARAGRDGWIVLAAWCGEEIVTVRAAKVGGPENIQPGMSYHLTESGEFEEVGVS